MLRILVIGLVALVAVLMLLPRPDLAPSIEVATVLDEPRALPDVGLVDQSGSDFSIRDLEGRPTLVFFGFTHCPDICPLTLAQIARATERLENEAPELVPQVLFVSVDPERDSPARIRTYLQAFDADFIGVTADDAVLAPLLQTLGVSVHKQTIDGESYNVVHNGTIYVLDRNADWAALFGGSSHDADIIVSDYLALQALAPSG